VAELAAAYAFGAEKGGTKPLTKRLAGDEAQKEGWECKAKREGV
jgi:hypothetical protein